MSIEKIKNPLTKILNRLDSIQENQSISKLDKEYLGNLMIEAYDHLQSFESPEPEMAEPPKHNVFQFDESDTGAPSKQTKGQEEEKEAEHSKPKEKASEEISEPKPKEEPAPKTEVEEEKEPEPRPEKNNGSDLAEEESASEELLSLFRIKESTELSERLSQMPINDIWNAMGLNERIFTQNELFGGDQESFRSTVQKLNQMESFDDARDFLISGAADRYSWEKEGRKNIAKNFVRLIQRKFK